MWVTLCVPSFIRACRTISSMALEICSRMARSGKSMPAIRHSVSTRESTSRGLVA
jgi:hypothetical protein